MSKLSAFFVFACVVSAHGAALRNADCMSTLDYSGVSIKEKELHVPPLEELADVLSRGLRNHFERVEVSVVVTPDLTQPPYYLASPGIGGACKLVEVGGVPNLIPTVKRDKIYDLKDLIEHMGWDPAFLAGAGAGPWPYLGVNCEGIVNLSVKDGVVDQGTRVVSIEPRNAPADATVSYVQQQLPTNETRSALLGNYFYTEGTTAKALKVVAEKRIGSTTYTTAIREILLSHYGEKIVGLGGMFLLREGTAKFHVMPDFSESALCSESDVESWLKYFIVRAPITVVGTLVTGDLDLDLRVQHFHGFSAHGDGGHFHYDTSPDSVSYEGYFVPASAVVRVDQPIDTHGIGRD